MNRPIAALSIGTLRVQRTYERFFRVEKFEPFVTIDSIPVPSFTTRNRWTPSISVRVNFLGQSSGRKISACALVDSGAEGIIPHMDQDRLYHLWNGPTEDSTYDSWPADVGRPDRFCTWLMGRPTVGQNGPCKHRFECSHD